MRFFSNEAKENTDDPEVADNETDRDRTETDGVAVPQQRSGSPWSDAPGSDTAETRDESLRPDDSEERHDGDDLVRDDSAPRDTDTVTETDSTHDADSTLDTDSTHDTDSRLDTDSTYDADSPRGDDEVDLPLDDRAGSHRAGSEATDESSDASEVSDAAPIDAQSEGTTTTYGPDGSVTTVDDADVATVASGTDVPDAATTDTTVSGDTVSDTTDSDSPAEQRDLAEAAPVTDTTVSDGTASDGTASDGTASETADGEPVPDTDSAADASAAPAVPVGAAGAATGAKPDLSASPVGDKLFTDGDSFNERLRDIALNFVDSPKDATAEAGALVDEAIEKVTSALKAQKDALAGEGDDTERLRVELRGYRDILQRISSL